MSTVNDDDAEWDEYCELVAMHGPIPVPEKFWERVYGPYEVAKGPEHIRELQRQDRARAEANGCTWHELDEVKIEKLSPVGVELCTNMERMVLDWIKQNSESNTFISPFSAMLNMSTLPFRDTQQQSEWLQLLGLKPTTNTDALAEDVRRLVSNHNKNKASRLFWCLAVVPEIRDKFGDLVAKVGIPVMETSFPEPATSEINKRVSEATEGRITEALGPGDTSDETVSVLVNAISYKDKWVEPFETLSRKVWKTPGCPDLEWVFMENNELVDFAKNDKYRYVGLPLEEWKVMEFFMTNDASQSPLGLTVDDMNELRKRKKKRDVTVCLPRWAVNSEINLRDKIAALVAPQLAENVPRMKQVTRLEVTEVGVVAAAATVDESDSCAEPGVKFVADRPFIYTIRAHDVTEYMGYMHNLSDVESPPLPEGAVVEH